MLQALPSFLFLHVNKVHFKNISITRLCTHDARPSNTVLTQVYKPKVGSDCRSCVMAPIKRTAWLPLPPLFHMPQSQRVWLGYIATSLVIILVMVGSQFSRHFVSYTQLLQLPLNNKIDGLGALGKNARSIPFVLT